MFVVASFFLLSIERFLYGYIYHFPESFKQVCNGPLKSALDFAEGKYWMVAKHLGVVIKVFQFGVIGYDLLSRPVGLASVPLLSVGALLVGAGQVLNAAVFNAIGAVGVYYGGQLGEKVPWCSGFPYNLGFGDPQYWGVVLFVWGLYVALAGASMDGQLLRHVVVPVWTTFWYVMSMKVLEDTKNGTAVLRSFGLKRAAA